MMPPLRDWRRLAWIAYALVLMTLTHLPPRDIEAIPFRIWDKLAHVIAYGGLGFLTALANASARDGRRPHRVALWLAALLLFAAFDEWTQPIFGRGCEFFDWCADFIGLCIGLIGSGLACGLWTRVFSPANAAAR